MTNVFSVDGDYFYDMETIMDRLNSELNPGTKVTIDTGTSEKARHEDFIDVDLIFSQMQEMAYEEFEELSDGYLEFVTNEQRDELASIISRYLDENTAPIGFNHVERTGKMEVTTE